jgi:hypothetical protein
VNGKLTTPGGAGASRDGTPKGKGKGGTVEDQDNDKCAVLDGVTIEKELEDLKGGRNKARQSREEAEGTFTEKDGRLNVLESVERDYPNTKKAYDAAYPQLARERDNFTDYFDSEKSSLMDRLGDAATEVQTRVDTFHDKTGQLEMAVAQAQQPEKGIPFETQQAVKDRTAELNAWKNLTGTVTGQHAELKKLRDDNTKARQEGHYGLAFGLVLIAEKKQAAHKVGPGLVEPVKLHGYMHSAGENLAKAQKDLATAQAEVEADKAAFAAAVKALDDHQKSAEAKLRVDLVDVTPTADGTTAQDEETSPADGKNPSTSAPTDTAKDTGLATPDAGNQGTATAGQTGDN